MALSLARVEQAIEEYKESMTAYGFTEVVEGRRGLIEQLIEGIHEAKTSAGLIEYVDAKDGMEGGGEAIWVVFKLDGKLYRINGYYASYDGSNWDDGPIEEVVAEEKVITVYKTVKKVANG